MHIANAWYYSEAVKNVAETSRILRENGRFTQSHRLAELAYEAALMLGERLANGLPEEDEVEDKIEGAPHGGPAFDIRAIDELTERIQDRGKVYISELRRLFPQVLEIRPWVLQLVQYRQCPFELAAGPAGGEYLALIPERPLEAQP